MEIVILGSYIKERELRASIMKKKRTSAKKMKNSIRKSAAQRHCDAVLGPDVVDVERLKRSHAEAIAGKGRVWRLTARQSRRFVKIMTSNEKPNKALLKAVKEYNADRSR